MADATQDLLKDLDDPSKFEKVVGVPVFQAHERNFPEQRLANGQVIPARTVKVTDADLYTIARRLNESIAATGHLPPLTEGHRRFDPDFPEKNQPRLLGFARNYRVDWVARDSGRYLAILEDEYVKVGCKDALGQYPYRSLEYDADGRIGEGTAFLIRPPFFKMGTTCLYQAETTMEPLTDEETKAYAVFEKFMKRYSAGAAMGAANGGPPAAAPASPPPPAAPYQAPVAPTVPVTTPVFPAGATFTLGADGRLVPYQAATPAVPVVPPVAPTLPASYAADLARTAADVAALRQQLAAEQAGRIQAECRTMLDPLRNLVTFDYQRELGVLTSLPDPAARAGHVKYMADNYGRLPGGSFIPVYAGDATPTPGAASDPTRDQPQRAAIRAYMLARPGCSYEAAEAAVLAGQK